MESSRVKIKDLLNSNNIVELLEEEQLADISNSLLKKCNDDIESRSEKNERLKDITKLAMSIAEEKSFPWPNASNTIFPLIATAANEFAAKCSPEILRDDFIVKSKVIGKDDGKVAMSVDNQPIIDPETGKPQRIGVDAKRKRGERVSTYMNYQLSEEIKGWQAETDRLLVSLPIVGMMFRKTFEKQGEIQSDIVYPDRLIVHDKTKPSAFDKTVITHVIDYYSNEIQERINSGYFIDFDYDGESSDSNSLVVDGLNSIQDEYGASSTNSGLHLFLEQCCWLDLDEDGTKEPYVVTIHFTSQKVVRIAPRYSEKDIEKEGKKIIKIRGFNPYTPYSFIPSPDGSFYAMGLGDLLFNLNKSINSSINQLTDAATLQNTGGGFIAKSLKIRGGSFKMRPNEYKQVDDYGASIKDAIVPMPTPQPSQTLFSLLGFLVSSGKELGSLRDVVTGENAAAIKPTTMVALVEQGITQFRSIFKRIYRSLKDEFKLIYEINSNILTNKRYAEILDEPVLEVSVKDDFSKKGFDIVPVADGSSITNTQRMAKAAFLMEFINDPYIDQIMIREQILSAFNIENYQDLITAPPPAQPDAGTILAQAELAKAENRLQEIQIKSVETYADIEKSKAEIEKIKTESIKNIADAMSKEKETQIKSITSMAEAIRKDIDTAINQQKRETLTLRNEKDNRQDNRENIPQEG